MRMSVNKGVLATAFATFIAFMGIGVVDPLLPLIGKAMGATPFEIEWLFTSYISVMAVCMLFTAFLTSRLGAKRTLMLGLSIVVIFSFLCGISNNITVFAALRGGWGFGNALFTSTALTIIVGISARDINSSITLYEAALGLGIASGPLLGGVLGSISWRDPFFGTAALMASAFLFVAATIRLPAQKKEKKSGREIFVAMRNRSVRTNALIALGYNYGFFTILAYSPLTLLGLTALELGFTYFFWGILVAFSSVIVVNSLRQRVDSVLLLNVIMVFLILIFLVLGFFPAKDRLYIIVASGFLCGISNALFTTLAINVSPFARPVSSAAYNFVRWGGAAIAPILSGYLGQTFGLQTPFLVAGLIIAISFLFLHSRSTFLRASMSAQSKAPETTHFVGPNRPERV